jgi:hypothetical protein
MRTLILSLLLASTAAMPALAQDRGDERRERAAQASDDRAQRVERRAARRADQQAASAEVERARPQRAERQQGVVSTSDGTAGQRAWANRRGSRDAVVSTAAPPPVVETVAPAQVRVVRAPDSGLTTTRDRRIRSGDSLVDRAVELRRARNGDQVIVPRDTTDTRRGDTRRGDTRWGDGGTDRRRWTGDWRNDRRYDWRRHRDRNRSVFRFGSYYDPYGYSYRRFSIGYSMYPSYYSSSYWLNDPWMYRLPPAYGPYRWVRYWDDALLVNIYTGQVVDVIHSFFW